MVRIIFYGHNSSIDVVASMDVVDVVDMMDGLHACLVVVWVTVLIVAGMDGKPNNVANTTTLDSPKEPINVVTLTHTEL